MPVGRTARALLALIPALILTVALGLVVAPVPQAAGQVGAVTSVGGDVSWPQCPKGVGLPGRRGIGLPLPPRTAGFMVVGLTNGIGFTVNPCLRMQVDYAAAHGIPLAMYAMSTYPTTAQVTRYGWSGPFTTATLNGRLSNTGYAEALRVVATLRAQAIATPVIWVDVESSKQRPWSRSKSRNIAVVTGWLRAYGDAGYRVGFYSSPYMWNQILGRGGPRGYPEWRTVGARGRSAAVRMCSSGSFQGGPAVLSQWWDRRHDYDVLCPQYRAPESLTDWFTVPGSVPLPTATPTPLPTATPTPTDIPTPTGMPTDTPTPTDTPPTDTPTPTDTPPTTLPPFPA